MGGIKGHHVGTIAVIYDHTQCGLSNALTDIQHRYSHIIKSSVHVYLNKEDCFEVVVLDGEGKEITEFAEALMALKGVKLSKLVTAESEETI